MRDTLPSRFAVAAALAAATLAVSGCSAFDRDSSSAKQEFTGVAVPSSSSSSTAGGGSDTAATSDDDGASAMRADRSASPAVASDPCTPSIIAADMGWSSGSIAWCDGTWAIGHDAKHDAFPVGDVQSVLKFEGAHWRHWSGIPASSDVCPRADAEGMPFAVRQGMGTCTTGSSAGSNSNSSSSGGFTVSTPSGRRVSPSSPACDGRGVLIVQSVVDDGDFLSELGAALESTPGAQFTMPGQCASLRASVDGQRIFPVFVDYGSNVSGLCAAVYPGANARILKHEADYSSPC